MADNPGTVDRILAEIGQALLPLRDALGSPDAFGGLLRGLGWQVTDIPPPVRDLGTALDTLYDSLRRLLGDGGINVGGATGTTIDGAFSPDEAGRTLAALQKVITAIRAIATAPALAFPPALVADGFPTLFPGQLLDYLVITYLQRFHPQIAFALRALGVVKSGYRDAAGNRPPYVHLSLEVADLPRVLADPAQVARNAFGWGTPDFDFRALASQLDNLFTTFGVTIEVEDVRPATRTAVQGVPADPNDAPASAIRGLIFDRADDNSSMTADIRLMPVPAADPGGAPGLALLPSFDGVLGFRFELGPDIAVTIRSDLDVDLHEHGQVLIIACHSLSASGRGFRGGKRGVPALGPEKSSTGGSWP